MKGHVRSVAGADRDIVKVVISQCRFTYTNFTFCILHTQVRKDIDIMCPHSIFLMLTKMVYIERLFMPGHWCSLLISISFSYSYNFMYTKGIIFNSGFYFTTIAIYSCWLDTSSNKSFVFSTTHLVQRSYERKLTTSTTLLSRLQLDFVL